MDEGERGRKADVHERVHSGHRTPADLRNEPHKKKKGKTQDSRVVVKYISVREKRRRESEV